ncbi:MAG: hypothetical protein MI702_00845, partial [Chlorobiales bacterium]|nr:hypothetical protein [Chlorobiales bacterium]
NDDQDGLVVRFLDKNGYSLDDKKRIIVRGVNHHRPFSIWNPILKKFIVVWIETVSQKSRRLRLTAVNIPAIG